MPNHTHTLLESIRLLEQKDFFLAQDVALATKKARQADGTLFDKLVIRAKLLDADQQIHHALINADLRFGRIDMLCSSLALILGLVVSTALLVIMDGYFFYVLAAFWFWHFFGLIAWIRPLPNKHTLLDSPQNLWQRLITPTTDQQEPIKHITSQVINQKRQPTMAYYVSYLQHKSYGMALLGIVLALLVIFWLNIKTPSWQMLQTPLDEQKLPLLPTMVGYDFSYFWITLIALAIVPRLTACIYCFIKTKHTFCIDKSLYYYENIIRQLKQSPTNTAPDHTAPTKTPIYASVSTRQKIVATLIKPSTDQFWYQFGAGFAVIDAGTINNQSDVLALNNSVLATQSQVYLGIDTDINPSQHALNVLVAIRQIAQYGLAVELLNIGQYSDTWQDILISQQIAQVRRT